MLLNIEPEVERILRPFALEEEVVAVEIDGGQCSAGEDFCEGWQTSTWGTHGKECGSTIRLALRRLFGGGGHRSVVCLQRQ